MKTVLPALDAAYWQQRYAAGRDGWDAGAPTPPLRAYFDQLDPAAPRRVLVPGAGRGYEAEYLHRAGCRQVFVADFAPEALGALAARVPDFPAAHLLAADFFGLSNDPPYDLIVEQTFFCALAPALRSAYARQCARLLRPGGTLVGLLFDTAFAGATEPPFGGTAAEYRAYFAPYFAFRHFAPATNSLRPRQGKELFICLKKNGLLP